MTARSGAIGCRSINGVPIPCFTAIGGGAFCVDGAVTNTEAVSGGFGIEDKRRIATAAAVFLFEKSLTL